MGHRGLQTLAAVLLAGLWGVGLGLVHLDGQPWFLDRVEATMADWRTLVRGVRKPPPVVLIVAIDDETARQEGKYPLRRGTLAGIIDEVAQFSPKAVALDILLLDTGDEAEDRALTDALARTSSVIAGAAVFNEAKQTVGADGGGALSRVPVADSFVLPLDRFSENASIGVVNVSTDYAGTTRLVPMVFRSGDRIQSSFPLQVASVALNARPTFEPERIILGDRSVPTDLGQQLPIVYYGPQGTIETVSAATVLDGDLSREQAEGRIVVIGATVIGSGDVFPTPFDPVLPGVEVISTAISHLVAGDGPVRTRPSGLLTSPPRSCCRWSLSVSSPGGAAPSVLPRSPQSPSSGSSSISRVLERHLAERGIADRGSRATRHPLRRNPALARPAKRPALCAPERASPALPGPGPAQLAGAQPRISWLSPCGRKRQSSSSTCPASLRSAR